MGHGRRMSTSMYIAAYQLCKYRDGERCAICHRGIGDPMPAKLRRKWKLTQTIESLEIDHIDGNPWHNPPDGTNWRLLCKCCNLEEEMKMGGVACVSVCERDNVDEGTQKQISVQKRRKMRKGAKEEAERVEVERMRREGRPGTRIVKESVPFREGEPSMQANAFYEPAYTRWIIEELEHRRFLPRKEAINGGAHVTGASPITCRRYLDKLCSPQGSLEEFRDETGEVLIRFKARFRKD